MRRLTDSFETIYLKTIKRMHKEIKLDNMAANFINLDTTEEDV